MFCSSRATIATSTDLRGSDESYRRPTTINMLPDDVLLEMFDFYQGVAFIVGPMNGKDWCAYAGDGDISYLRHHSVLI